MLKRRGYGEASNQSEKHGNTQARGSADLAAGTNCRGSTPGNGEGDERAVRGRRAIASGYKSRGRQIRSQLDARSEWCGEGFP